MKQKPTQQTPSEAQVHPESVVDRYYLFAMLGTFANRMQVVGDKAFEEVTWKQWFVMLGASVYDGVPSVSQVAEFVGSSHQNVKQLLLRLQSAEMVKLLKDPEDQRRTLVHLTEKANAFERKYRQQSQEFMDELFTGISPNDLVIARQVLNKLDYNLRELEASSSGKRGKA